MKVRKPLGRGANGRQAAMLTLQPLADRWTAERTARREALARTIRTDRAYLQPIIDVFGARPLGQLGPWVITDWIEGHGHHLAASTFASRWRLARRWFRWVHTETGAPDPMADLRAPRPPRSEPRALDRGQVAALLASAPHSRGRAAILLGVQMGLRRAEVCGLCHEDWSRSRGTMRVVGKGGHERTLPVPDEAARALAVYLADWPAHHGPLLRTFTTGRALAPVTLSREFRECAYRAGTKVGAWDGVGLHSLRHTAACDVLDAGADVPTIAEMLGHANPATAGIYLRRARLGRLSTVMGGRQYAA